jgi:hypothetical protein
MRSTENSGLTENTRSEPFRFRVFYRRLPHVSDSASSSPFLSQGYAVDSAGIHHLTPPAPLECAVGQSAFGHMSVRADRCELHWTGKLPPARWRCKPASDSGGDTMEAVVEWPTVMMYPTRQPNAAESTRQPSSL